MTDLNPGGGDVPKKEAGISGAPLGYGQVPLQSKLFASEPADSAYLKDTVTDKLYEQLCLYRVETGS
jgi:hypothetical protein